LGLNKTNNKAMRTIKDYKQQFIQLANELEQEFGSTIRSIYIARTGDGDDDEPISRCDIEF
jgi:hypothetical protein